MEKKKDIKDRIRKGAPYVGSAAVGAAGGMAYNKYSNRQKDDVSAIEEEQASVIEATVEEETHGHVTPSGHSNESETIVAELSDEQVADLKAELRDEIKAELLEDPEFIRGVEEEVMRNVVVVVPEEPTNGPGQNTVTHGPEMEVLDYGTITDAEGNTYSSATVRIEGTDVLLVDENHDDYVDVAIVDVNGNHQFDQNDEIQDVSGMGLEMSSLRETVDQHDSELLAGNGEPVENTDDIDFINNADISEFCA